MQKVNLEVMKMMKSVVEVCASKYNFDAEEGYRMICNCEGLEIKSSSKRSKKISSKAVKSAFPLPYNGEMNGEWCFGLRLNSGLYTQCPSIRLEDGAYCGSCNKQATKNEHGLPDYGSIQTRSSKYTKDEEFVDPSGKKPVAYTKVMKKFKVTEEQVREEAAKHNMTLDPRHFVEAVKKSGRPAKEPKEPKEMKAKGRPKKSKKVLELAGEEEDLFASLVMSSLVPSAANKSQLLEKVDENEEEIVVSVAESEADSDDNSSLGDVDIIVDAKVNAKASKPKAEKKPKVSAEEKAALAEQKKLALAEQKAAEKLALAEQKKVEALAQQNQKKQEALAQQNQKKLALAEQKAAEKQALAEQKAAEKLALSEQKKKPLSEAKKEKKVATKKTKVDDTPAFVETPVEEADVVKKIMFEGKKYLKSKNTGIIYNMDQDVIGKWNEEKNRIDFDETGEESEEEYDEDN